MRILRLLFPMSVFLLNCISQFAEEESILDIGAAVPSVPCVRLGRPFRPPSQLSREREGGHNTKRTQHSGHSKTHKIDRKDDG